MKKEKQERLPEFSERLALLQAQYKESISEFAEFLGLSRQTVGFYLTGNRLPDAKVLSIICKRCRVSADWLLGLTDDMPLDPAAKIAANYSGLSAESIEFLHLEKERFTDRSANEAPIAGLIKDKNAFETVDNLLADCIDAEINRLDQIYALPPELVKQINNWNWIRVANVQLTGFSFQTLREIAEIFEEIAFRYIQEKIKEKAGNIDGHKPDESD